MKKVLSILIIAVVVSFGNISQASAMGFSDIEENHRFAPHMSYLFNEGIIKGIGNNRFGPNEPVTRATAAIMIARALELDVSNTNVPFKDVANSSAAAGSIQAMASKGIITGYTDGNFQPYREVTRAEMAILLAKAFELKEKNYFAFKDVSGSMSSYDAIRKIVTYGIASGYSEEEYRPNEPLTRAQFSAFLARAMSDEFRLATKKPGEKEVTTKEAYVISSQLVQELNRNLYNLQEKHHWGSLNPGKPEIAAPILKENFSTQFMEEYFNIFIESYFCDCDQEIAPKIKDVMIRFDVSNVQKDSFTITGLYLTNFIVTEPHFHSIDFKVEDGKWKIVDWHEKNVTTENLNLTKEEVEKAMPDFKVVGEFYSEEAGSIVYELNEGVFPETMGVSKKDGDLYFK